MFALGSTYMQVTLYPCASTIANTLRNVRTSAYSGHRKNGTEQNNSSSSTRLNEDSDIKINHAFNGIVNDLDLHLVPTSVLKPPDPRYVSHISAKTFFENKYGFPEKVLLHGQPGSLMLGSRFLESKLACRQWCPSRGFKTDKKLVGVGSSSKRNTTRLGSIFDKFSNKTTAKPKSEFLKYIDDKHMSAEMQEKVKLAFAEGYAAKEKIDSTTGGKKNRLLTSIRTVLTLGMVVYLIVMIAPLFGKIEIGGMRGIGMSNAEVNPEDINVTFSDVRGADEAKEELKDIVDFLRDPSKFSDVGARLPKGVLLVGPPGVGKTLLARAVAGEADVPFFHASGSDFDEMFVGTGAKRVRQLFGAAKLKSPCVIFIDEIDTVGAKRTSSVIHPYANQTINQLLSEMDGFEQNEGIIILGATNKREHLDEALLRPGRFDIEVVISKPDLKGRKDILDLYLEKVKYDDTVDATALARGTTGFSGADLQNLVNQAALKAALDNDPFVTQHHMEYSRDKVIMGPAKRSKIMDEQTNWMTAYHEAGHTLVAHYTNNATALHKVTIIPRGISLGHTSFIPDKEQYSQSKSQLLALMDVSMGGRVAEELMLGADNVTTGASGDFSTATGIATAMVKRFGMSDKIGVRVFSDNVSDSGLSMVNINEVSPAVTEQIDQEIKRLLQESYERAKHILKLHSSEHKALASALMKYETLDAEEIKMVIEGRRLKREI